MQYRIFAPLMADYRKIVTSMDERLGAERVMLESPAYSAPFRNENHMMGLMLELQSWEGMNEAPKHILSDLGNVVQDEVLVLRQLIRLPCFLEFYSPLEKPDTEAMAARLRGRYTGSIRHCYYPVITKVSGRRDSMMMMFRGPEEIRYEVPRLIDSHCGGEFAVSFEDDEPFMEF